MTTQHELDPAKGETVQTTHEVRCKPLGERSVRLVVTDQIAVVKVGLLPGDLEQATLAVNLRDLLGLNDTILKGSQALMPFAITAPLAYKPVAPMILSSSDRDESSNWAEAYQLGRREERESRRRWWWPFG